MKIIDLKIKIAAAKVLLKEVNIFKLERALINMSISSKKGEPFANLEIATEQKDKDSRALIAEAILLYRELDKIFEKAESERIIRKVIIEAAIAQLRCLIPVLKEEDLRNMTKQDRTKCYCDIVSKFPNTDWVLEKDSESEVVIKMTRCRLVEIFDALELSHLRDSCCEGDSLYFERYQKSIDFCRDSTIGAGCENCMFCFKLKN